MRSVASGMGRADGSVAACGPWVRPGQATIVAELAIGGVWLDVGAVAAGLAGEPGGADGKSDRRDEAVDMGDLQSVYRDVAAV
ncbi:MAG TPA: hypothetical protein PKE61_14790 [Burkholderiaceae bacterium]|nr:hypothetical protein [Burkholderiaceae bacterium]HMZ01485.1 hypothetical protein [Burkholderiaceae bacterium]